MKLFQTKISDSAVGRISSVLQSGDLGFGPNVNLMEERFKDFSSKEYNIGVNSA